MYYLAEGARISNGNKMDVKLSTHMRDVGMRVCMFNPLVHCAAKEENIVSEAVRPYCKEIENHT